MSGTGARDLEGALDELYAVDPADFMATRKQLVADLRAAGDAGAAKELGAARRPTNAAWALNQLARRHGDLVEQFLEQSRALREAQDQAVSGRPDELRSATRAQRDALAAVTQAANAVLGKGMTEAYRAQIAATLQAASVDDATADVLRQGRVIREVSGATGFPDAGGFTLADVTEISAAKSARSRLPRTRESGDAKTRVSGDSKANEQRARAAAELASAEKSQRDAEDAVTSAEESAAAAKERIDTLREELERARQEARAATEAVNDARRAAKDTAKLVERARRTVEKLSEEES